MKICKLYVMVELLQHKVRCKQELLTRVKVSLPPKTIIRRERWKWK